MIKEEKQEIKSEDLNFPDLQTRWVAFMCHTREQISLATIYLKHSGEQTHHVICKHSVVLLWWLLAILLNHLLPQLGRSTWLLIASPVSSHSTTHSLTCVCPTIARYITSCHSVTIKGVILLEKKSFALQRCHLVCFSVSAQFCMLINRWSEMFRRTNQHGTYFFKHAVEQQNARK